MNATEILDRLDLPSAGRIEVLCGASLPTIGTAIDDGTATVAQMVAVVSVATDTATTDLMALLEDVAQLRTEVGHVLAQIAAREDDDGE